ncbi:unnamed protein product [Rhodiola kirilowii]
MDLREGQNIMQPPLLEGDKYGYWRVRMKAFLKAHDESVWEAVEQGWTHPVTIDKGGRTISLAKNRWTEEQKNAEAANSKALNAISSGVDGKKFKMILTCEIAKTSWDMLQTAHEGTKKVQISRMEMVTSKSESLRMQEDETIADFNTRVPDISNESFALGEPMSEEITEECIADKYKELFNHWLEGVELNKKLQCSLTSLKHEKEKLREKDEILVEQKAELLDVISSLKIQMEKDKNDHAKALGELKKRNDVLSRKEVRLLEVVSALEIQIEMEKEAHATRLKQLSSLQKSTKMLNSGSKNLDSILTSQRIDGGHKGL